MKPNSKNLLRKCEYLRSLDRCRPFSKITDLFQVYLSISILSNNSKNEKKLNKIKNQIQRSKQEEELIKIVCPDEITKIALVIVNCNDLLDCSELSVEEKLKLRIAGTDIVQKMIKKFKLDFPGSEQWIDVTIDLLDVKKIMKSYKNKELVKRLDKQLKQRRSILQHYKVRNKIEDDDRTQNEIRNQSEQEIKKVMKRIKLSDLADGTSDNIDSLVKEVNVVDCKSDVDPKAIGKKEDTNIMDIIKNKLDRKNDQSTDESNNNESSGEESDNDDESSMQLDEEEKQTNLDKKIDDEENNEIDDEENNCSEQQSDEEENDSSNDEESEDLKKETVNDKEKDDEEVEYNSDEEIEYSDEEDNCSIDSSQFDKWVDNTVEEEYLNNLDKDAEEDVLIEDYEFEPESVADEEKSKSHEDDLGPNDESANDGQQTKLNDSTQDVEKASEDYMKSQLVKAFGEKLANKTLSKDVSSDEEWDDDFFINKKVKKFKPTVVDLERYKDLEEKEQGHSKQENDLEAEESDEDKAKRRFKKTNFNKKRKFKS